VTWRSPACPFWRGSKPTKPATPCIPSSSAASWPIPSLWTITTGEAIRPESDAYLTALSPAPATD